MFVLKLTGTQGKIASCAAAGVLALAMLAGCGGSASQSSSAAPSSEAAQVSVQSESASAASASASAAATSTSAAASSAASPASSTAASAASESASSASASKSSAATQEVLEFGVTSDEALTMLVGNELGTAITDIAFAETGSEDAPSYLMEDDDEWAAGAKANVHFNGQGEGAKYDVYVEAGDNEYVLHNMNIDGVKELTIRLEGDVAYAEFKRDGDAISTLSDEMEIASRENNNENADVEEGYEDYDEDYYYDDSDEEDYSEDEYYDDSEDYEDYEDVDQEEDSCVDGGVELR